MPATIRHDAAATITIFFFFVAKEPPRCRCRYAADIRRRHVDIRQRYARYTVATLRLRASHDAMIFLHMP